MIDLSILKPIAFASILATGAAGTSVATGTVGNGNAEIALAGTLPQSVEAPAVDPSEEKHRARRARANGDRMELRVRALVQRLDLTDAQVAQLRQILASKREAARAIRELPAGERGAARRELMQSTRAAIAAVLTPAQRASFQAMESERRAHGPRATPAQRSQRENGVQGRAVAAEHRESAAEHRARAAERRAAAAEQGAVADQAAARRAAGNRPAHAGRRGPRAGR